MNEAAKAFEQAAANLTAVAKSGYPAEVTRAVDLIVATFRRGNKILVFGNGGSAADAQHICAELVGRFALHRPGLPVIALGGNQSTMTAWSNDYTFDTLFERELQALGKPGDLAWGISTSGNSFNVLAALKYAREAGLATLGLTGEGGGKIAPFCDVLLAVPLRETPRIQEVHLVTYHSICAQVEETLFGNVRSL
ncbi:MAG TPA: SIS domain-containing protein [Bryobacteraceae bacterium]|nr:SIS domain-containing protein [Bryobacteraceae bacterium]